MDHYRPDLVVMMYTKGIYTSPNDPVTPKKVLLQTLYGPLPSPLPWMIGGNYTLV